MKKLLARLLCLLSIICASSSALGLEYFWKKPLTATARLEALLNDWPYVDRQQPSELQFTLENVNQLIHEGADVNIKNKDDVTPLSKAAGSRDVRIVRLLLKNGATVDESIPLIALAVVTNSPEIVHELIAHGANVNQKDQYGSTPLYLATQLGNTQNARLLLNAAADVNLQDASGNTPIMFAIGKQDFEMIRLLLTENTDLSIQNNEGKTAWDIANDLNNPDVINFINTAIKKIKRKIG